MKVKQWLELPKEVLEDMNFFGNLSPTVHPEYMEVKGYLDGDKVYLRARDLIRVADSFRLVAQWLIDRALAETEQEKVTK